MGRVIIAFPHNATREKIGRFVELCGHELRGSCRSGAEVLRAVRQSGGAVICGYKLSDMTADELARCLDGSARMLVIASPINLEHVENSEILRLAAPFSRVALQEALNELFHQKEPPASRPVPPQRTPEEVALINHAKEVLMARGMTEPQAHSLLQQRSMRNRCRMTQTAEEIIITYEINARKAP